MGRVPVSPWGSSQATFALLHVALPERVGRQATAPQATCTGGNVALGSQATGTAEKSDDPYAARSLVGFTLGMARSRISSATDTASTSAGFVARMKSVRTETKRNGLSR